MTRFEEIGVDRQVCASTIPEATRQLELSCKLCCLRGLHIDCDSCAIRNAHMTACAVIKDVEDAMTARRVRGFQYLKQVSSHGSNPTEVCSVCS